MHNPPNAFCSKATIIIMLSVFSAMVAAENLFDPDRFKSFVADERAYKVGDVVTLLIVESASAQSSRDTGANKNLDMSAGFSKAIANGAAANSGRSESISTNLAYASDDARATARKGNFRAQMTVQVKNIDQAGKLFVTGQQKIVVNGEEQLIKASGWLRNRDINEDNTALSLRLSDASIEYSGESEEGDEGLIRKAWGYVKKIW